MYTNNVHNCGIFVTVKGLMQSFNKIGPKTEASVENIQIDPPSPEEISITGKLY